VRKGQLKSLCIFQKKKKRDKKHVSAVKGFTNGVLSQAQKEDLEAAGREQETGKVSPNVTILALCKDIMTILDQKPADDPALDNKFSALAEQLMERQPLPFNESATFRGTLHCEAGLASILDQSTRGVIQARIDAVDPKDEQVCHSLLELLDRTQVGFFSIQPVAMVNPCSIHGVGLHTSCRGIKTLMPSVPSFSCLFVIGWNTHHRHCHARVPRYHHEMHLTGMDPGTLRGSHE